VPAVLSPGLGAGGPPRFSARPLKALVVSRGAPPIANNPARAQGLACGVCTQPKGRRPKTTPLPLTVPHDQQDPPPRLRIQALKAAQVS